LVRLSFAKSPRYKKEVINLLRILTAIAVLASFESSFSLETALAQNDPVVNTGDAGRTLPSVGDGIAAYSLQEYERANQIWQALAEQGDAEAQYRLGLLYDLGLGVEQNSKTALHWFEKAGDAGFAAASFAAANIYAGGRGVAADAYVAFEWYLVAAEQGHPRAQYQVATILLLGELAEKDEVGAAFWFGMAARNLVSGPEQQRARSAYEIIFGRLSPADKLVVLKNLSEQAPGHQ
jgi:TPR repeat protein